MPKKRYQKFTPEFREETAKLVVEAKRSIASVAADYAVGETTLANWVKKYREAHPVEEEPLELSERARLKSLEREVRELEMENNFLRKAAAYFAREQR